ncbi:ATP-binding protein [Schnuerera sp.]|uniref:ATP-binding protein n=1 Tax=Schnuerera sp. TaxID=2794844 RepID=UPI002C917D00|nr:ATP-binding protein [Schnuerera sp.]HSH36391.1 ATP-binding protein [Schnuerera sp.]
MIKVRRMFPGGNTSQGFYSFHDNIIGSNKNMLYILKGMPGGGKSSLMKYIAEKVLKEGYNVEYHHCPSDPESIDGIVIEELNIGIVDGTAPHIIDPVYPGLVDRLIDLGQFIDVRKLSDSKNQIINAKLNNKKAYGKAFAYFKAAKIVHEIIEEGNKTGVDFNRVNMETKLLIDEIIDKKPNDIKVSFKERHLFSNANTPQGFVDYTEFILEGIQTIYYLQGEIGTGKSTLLNRLIEECKIRGYHIEIYHNSTIPEKIESLIIIDLNICITSNKYGIKYADKKIDLNKYFDDRIKNSEDYNTYKLLIKKATDSLANASENHQILEKVYKPAVNYSGVNRIREELLNEILAYGD